MKYVFLIWKNLLRNRRRSLLTILSVAASLFLVTTLRTVLSELQAVSVAPLSQLRLVTRHAVSFTNPMPIAYRDRIRRIPGVRDVMPGNWFAGIYIDENNFFGQFTVDPDRTREIMPEAEMADEQWAAFRSQRNAAVAGVRLFQRFGWKIGQRITLRGTNYPADLEVVLVGTFKSVNPPDETNLWIRWDYLDEAIGRAGEAQWFTVVAATREDVPRVIAAIDDMFRSSSAPTKTETEREFQLSFSGILGNVQFLVTSVSSVVVFTILLVTAATMGMSIRERTAELGILRALGFPADLLATLLVGESLVVTVGGWLLGCVGARLLYANIDLQEASGGWFTVLRVQPGTLALGLALSAAVAFFSTALPAYRASRVNVADALRFAG